MAEKTKVTIMVLQVDLQCSKCYKKVKKLLCKFHQIRDQVFDEKTNTVTIRVVCCSPEKIRDKLCCKGDGSIKSIEIKEPEKPRRVTFKEPEKPTQPEKPKPKPNPVVKEPEKPKPVANEPEKPKEILKEPEKPKEIIKEPEKPKLTPPPPAAPAPVPVPVPVMLPEPMMTLPSYPPVQSHSFGVCCEDCYGGRSGGPCYQLGYGPYGGYAPAPCYGRPVFDSWGGGGGSYRSCRVGRFDCMSEENPEGCSIM